MPTPRTLTTLLSIVLAAGTACADRLIVRPKPDAELRREIVDTRFRRGIRDTRARTLTARELDAAVASRRARALGRLRPITVRRLEPLDAFVVDVPEGLGPRLRAHLDATGDYAWVAPDTRLPSAREADDPLYPFQYHHEPANLNSSEAWLYNTGSTGVILAVIDTGIDTDHPDLPTILPGYNAMTRTAVADGGSVEDHDGHGTAVLGVAAAAGGNGFAAAGVAWELSVIPVKASETASEGATLADIIDGAFWAADHGATIINASYEGANLQAVGDLGQALRDRGVLLVWSAGNTGQANVPLDHAAVTVVAAVDANRNWAPFSAYGPGVDLTAPGVDIQTLGLAGSTSARTGTSYSAPMIAGAMGLIWSADPTLPADSVEQLLIDFARDLRDPGRDTRTGWGLPDLGGALAHASFGTVAVRLPLAETFSTEILDRTIWPEAVGWAVLPDEAAGFAPAVLRLSSGNGRLTSRPFDATNAEGVQAVRVFARAQGRKSRTLRLNYLDDAGVWRELALLRAVDFSRMLPLEVPLPDDARHPGLRFELASDADTAAWWEVDNIRIGTDRGITLPWRETFDDDPDPVLKWDTFDATTAQTPLTPSGLDAAFIPADNAIVSKDARLSDFVDRAGFTISAAWFVRPDNAPAGATATLEYSTDQGQTWLQLDGVTADGEPTFFFQRRVVALPFLSLINETIRLRVRTAGGAFAVDDLQLTDIPPDEPRCRADVNDDGIVNNTDINMFVNSWLAGDPLADVLVDGLLDLGDVQVFLDWATLACQ